MANAGSSAAPQPARKRKGPSEAWFAARTLEQSLAWIKAAENYERCGFGSPKLRYIAERLRLQVAEVAP
jgi:hypothetical protein